VNRRSERSRLLGEGGLTLPEILVALAVTGVALGALAIVVPIATSGIHQAQQLSAATFLAEQLLERARAATWTASPALDCLGVSIGDAAPVPAGATCHGATSSAFPDDAREDGDPRYRSRVRVSNCASTPCAGTASDELRRIEVTIAYTPLTNAGVSTLPATVRLEGLVTRQ
jgi:prepilin-type N-terminal cleavage/methylation domain-containing protein